MKVYISGQITGLDIEEAKEMFSKRAELIASRGDEPINPFDIIEYDPDLTWNDYMAADIKALFDCDAITLLPNWGQSKGAMIEVEIAKCLGLAFFSY